MPTKIELMAEISKLRERIKENEELLMKAAIRAKELQAEITAIKRPADKKPK